MGLWTLNLYPDAGEAGGCLDVPRRAPVRRANPDHERAQAEAGRRARAQVRRYCAANRLNRLGTLTYGGVGCHDPRGLRLDLADFFRQMRRELSERVPYLWVPEWHPGGHGLHAHFAVGRYVNRKLIERCWGRGIVHIKLLGDLPVGSASLEEARLSARYLSKYVTKSIGDDRYAGLHRYEVAQGFQPERVYCYGPSSDVAIANASEVMGRAPTHVWRSDANEGWTGAPACWLSWAD